MFLKTLPGSLLNLSGTLNVNILIMKHNNLLMYLVDSHEILIFGECDCIFVVAYEIIKRFGELLHVNIGANRKEINSHIRY